MNTVEIFSGTKSFSKVAEKLGHKTLTVDFDPSLEPDICIDVMKLDIELLTKEKVDVLWMSPPCTTFSVASIGRYWKNGKPTNDKALQGIGFLKKAIEIKDRLLEINPQMKWYIENPRGMMRKMDFMRKYHRKTVTYCQYGLKVQKPTDIWTNDVAWVPRKPCHPGSPCHDQQPRGFRAKKAFGCIGKGVQGQANARDRGVIPESLFMEIFQAYKPQRLIESYVEVKQ